MPSHVDKTYANTYTMSLLNKCLTYQRIFSQITGEKPTANKTQVGKQIINCINVIM